MQTTTNSADPQRAVIETVPTTVVAYESPSWVMYGDGECSVLTTLIA